MHGIAKSKRIGPFRVPDGVKLTSSAYVKFRKDNFLPWYRKQRGLSKKQFVFMQDNASSRSAKATAEFLRKIGFKDNRLMNWLPACSPDLTSIENLWVVVKRRIYHSGQQFKTKDELWNEIKKCCMGISPDEIKKLTQSMDNRLVSVIEKHGG